MVKRHYMELPTGTVLILELNAPVHLASAGFVSAATSIQIHTP
jgi:hypothetical protein